MLAGGVLQLGREGAGADARDVCLGYSHDALDEAGRNPGALRHPGRSWTRRGYEGVDSMVDVYMHALRPFEQHAPVKPLGNRERGVADAAFQRRAPASGEVVELLQLQPVAGAVVVEQRLCPRHHPLEPQSCT